MKILFSPVGMTDPISENKKCKEKDHKTYYDGSLLHICRYYKPDIVYIYLSGEAMRFESDPLDKRYTSGLELLKKEINWQPEIIPIKRQELVDVHLFDYFITEFKELLRDIRAKHSDAEIYLNVSSGTPAMKSALQVLSATDVMKLIPLQVATAYREANRKVEKHDLTEEWQNNLDNLEGAESRVNASQNKNMLFEFVRLRIEELIDQYDYKAIRVLCDGMNELIPDRFSELLDGAILRYDMKSQEAFSKFGTMGYADIMGEDPSQLIQREYFLLTDIKIKSGEYADYLRSLTPLILELFKSSFKKDTGIDLNDCMTYPYSARWSLDKIKGSAIDQKFSQNDIYHNKARKSGNPENETYLLSWQISNLLENLSQNEELIRKTIIIRKFEEDIRNLAAHTIQSFTSEDIKNKTSFSPEDMHNHIICYIRNYTDIPMNDDILNSYHKMNVYLKNALNNI